MYSTPGNMIGISSEIPDMNSTGLQFKQLTVIIKIAKTQVFNKKLAIFAGVAPKMNSKDNLHKFPLAECHSYILPTVQLLYLFQDRTLGISGCASFPSCHTTSSVKALEETRHCSKPVVWPHPFFINHYQSP